MSFTPAVCRGRERCLVAGLVALLPLLLAAGSARAPLSLADRVAAQRAVEQVSWSHRIWPKENPGPKPSLAEVLPEAALVARVEEGLRKSAALERFWSRSIEPEALQVEMNRMAERSQDPETLRELFDALHDDPALVAETLARPALADRLLRDWYAGDARFHGALRRRADAARAACATAGCMRGMGGEYSESTWRLRSSGTRGAGAPDPDDPGTLDREEWGAFQERLAGMVGGRPDDLALLAASPVIETPESYSVTTVLLQDKDRIRTATMTFAKVPFETWWDKERGSISAAVDPGDATYTLPAVAFAPCTPGTWTPTSMGSTVPSARRLPNLVWTGAEMIVWGGTNDVPRAYTNTGARYDPATDSWRTLSAGPGVPSPRGAPLVVWTGTKMIVWGGLDASSNELNSGGRYDPAADAWAPTSTGTNVPAPRALGTAVWSGTEMIVWGGYDRHCELSCNGGCCNVPYNTGGRYNPSTDTWLPTSTGTGVPTPRYGNIAAWTGSKMLIWAGFDFSNVTNTGGLYDPAGDTWQPTLTGANVLSPRYFPAGGWTGTEMILWAGNDATGIVWDSGAYDPAVGLWRRLSGAGTPHQNPEPVWTGSTLIVWGGFDETSSTYVNTGVQYNVASDTWTPTTAGPGLPSARIRQGAAWDGAAMMIWGGEIVNSGGAFTDTGARYCPCVAGGIFYRDLDADGYGDPAVPVAACDGVIPSGYVSNAADCNDSNAFIHPGTLELCDGIDNNCDSSIDNTALPPVDPVAWIFGQVAWGELEQATGYDMVYGDLNTLRSTGGDFTAATLACYADDTPLSAVPFPFVPAVGNGTWFLVRGVNCGGPGSYDGEAGQVGVRDAEIAAAPGACP